MTAPAPQIGKPHIYTIVGLVLMGLGLVLLGPWLLELIHPPTPAPALTPAYIGYHLGPSAVLVLLGYRLFDAAAFGDLVARVRSFFPGGNAQ
jgi:hypothetical protein